ncbi:f-actin capping protein, beta subunit, partial [Ostertagia ostertagi]
MSEQQLDCALDLMRRLPPQQCERNLIDLIDLVPGLCEDLLGTVDQPLKVAKDKETGKEYLLCDYSRDGDSYRSPWTNTYDPPAEDAQLPSEKLRKWEIESHMPSFERIRDMYFEGGISSVYFWDLDHGFAGVVLIKKILFVPCDCLIVRLLRRRKHLHVFCPHLVAFFLETRGR